VMSEKTRTARNAKRREAAVNIGILLYSDACGGGSLQDVAEGPGSERASVR
jgi:hypothetical protein